MSADEADGALAAADGAAAPTFKAALDAAKTPLTFKFRRGSRQGPVMSKWHEIDDLVPFCEVANATKSWNTRALRDATYHVMEAAACASSAIFADMRLTEIATPTCSTRQKASTTRPTRSGRGDRAGGTIVVRVPRELEGTWRRARARMCETRHVRC